MFVHVAPCADEAVEQERVLGILFLLGLVEEQEAEFLHRVQIHPHLLQPGQQLGNLLHPTIGHRRGQTNRSLPDAEPVIGLWHPTSAEVLGREQPRPTAPGLENTAAFQGANGGVGGAGQLIRQARALGAPAVAAIPLHGEPRIGVEVRFLLPQHLVEGGVDEQQGVPHRHVGPVGLTHPRIPGEHRNTGANGRLGQINRGDGPLHERPQGLRQLGFEPSDEQPAGDGISIHRSRTASQDYGRSESIAGL